MEAVPVALPVRPPSSVKLTATEISEAIAVDAPALSLMSIGPISSEAPAGTRWVVGGVYVAVNVAAPLGIVKRTDEIVAPLCPPVSFNWNEM